MRDVVVTSPHQNESLAEGVTWRVNSGDYWVIAGLQSAGKSNFLLTTAGLRAPDCGDYRLFGEPMPILDEHELDTRLRLGLVFETGQLFHRLTLAENIALPLRYHRNLNHGDAWPVVAAWIEAFDLEPWAHRRPGGLGRQWQKRAALARALVLKPDVLLLDEPLAGLDPRQSQWWLDFLAQLSRGHRLLDKKPLTLVVTAADLRPWIAHARQFAWLHERRFAILSTPAQLQSAAHELALGLRAEPAPQQAPPAPESPEADTETFS